MKAARGVCLLDERGLVFPVTLFVLVVLALLAAALGSSTASGLESGRLADWSRKALYAAEAGVEHQIHLLKEGSAAYASGSLAGTPEARYQVERMTPLVPTGRCTLPLLSVRRDITARGALVQGAEVVAQRRVRAVVELCFLGILPRQVSVEDWSEL